MPGQTTCFQCGSVLSAEPTIVEGEPPRMAAWKRPWRWLGRQVRATRIFPHPKLSGRTAESLHVVLHAGLIGILLSIIPGLAHAIQRRSRSVHIYVVLWGSFVLGMLFFYGGFLGMAFLGLAIAVHAWIALHAGLLREVAELRYRLLALAMVVVGLVFLYRGVGRLVFGDITGGHVTEPVAFHHVHPGDFILARRSLARTDTLTRGSLVLATMGGIRGRFVGRDRHLLVAQIVALAGDTLAVEQAGTAGGRCYVVNGRRLEREKYPVPGWLTRPDLSVIVPQGHCFLSTAYQATGQYGSTSIASICVVPVNDIKAKAFMRWSPVWRRGFIREVE